MRGIDAIVRMLLLLHCKPLELFDVKVLKNISLPSDTSTP